MMVSQFESNEYWKNLNYIICTSVTLVFGDIFEAKYLWRRIHSSLVSRMVVF